MLHKLQCFYNEVGAPNSILNTINMPDQHAAATPPPAEPHQRQVRPAGPHPAGPHQRQARRLQEQRQHCLATHPFRPGPHHLWSHSRSSCHRSRQGHGYRHHNRLRSFRHRRCLLLSSPPRMTHPHHPHPRLRRSRGLTRPRRSAGTERIRPKLTGCMWSDHARYVWAHSN